MTDPDTAYRRLGAVAGALGGAVDASQMAQEVLDFIAVCEGLKPMMLVGRGLGEPRWVAGALGVAEALGLSIVPGPFWSAQPAPADAPGWYAAHREAVLRAGRAWAVAATPDIAAEAAAVGGAGGRPSVAQEARLLGYPECCVAAHYAREACWHRFALAALDRLADGDAVRMRALLAGGTAIAPETETERALFAAATDLRPCPFTSWNMCPGCANDADSRSARLSQRYQALAERVDPELAALLRPG